MRLVVLGLAAALLTPARLGAQVRPSDPRPVPAKAPGATANPGYACELVAGGGIVLPFAACPSPGEARTAKEVEIVEYRDGDSPVRVARIKVRGAVRADLDALHLGWSDPDDDGDGLPTRVAGRTGGGRMKVGRVTLRRTNLVGTDRASPPLEAGELAGDAFPVAVDLLDPSGGIATVAFRGCRAAADTGRTPGTMELTCREVRTVAALDANPYARLITRAAENPDDISLLHRRAPAAPATPARGTNDEARGSRALRLEGAQVEGWSVDFDPAHEGTGRWTLELRVDRLPLN